MRSYDVDRYAGMRECDYTPLLNRNITEARRHRAFRWTAVKASETARRAEVTRKPDDSRSSAGSGINLSKSHMQIALDLMRR